MDRAEASVLLLLNGLPGAGKSTLARRIADGREATVVLDVDGVRTALPRPRSTAAGLAARRIVLGAATERLRAGDAVIVPQYLGRPEFVLQLDATAAATGAPFVEVVLDVPFEVAAARFAARSAVGAAPEHGDAAAMLEAAGGRAELVRMAERLAALVAARPHTVRIAPNGAETVLDRLLGGAYPAR